MSQQCAVSRSLEENQDDQGGLVAPHNPNEMENVFMTRSYLECGDYSYSVDVDTSYVDVQRHKVGLHHQQVLFDEEREDEYIGYTLKSNNVSLRRPLNEEIERYTIALAARAQARSDLHLRNRVVSGNRGNPRSVFIKENNTESKVTKMDTIKEETKQKEVKEIRIWAKKGSKEKATIEAIP